MGAGQATQIGLRNPDKFGYIGCFSGGGMARSQPQPDSRLLLFFMGAGSAEAGRMTAAKAAVVQLEAANAKVIGSVLNRVDLVRNPYYYQSYYRKEYARYYVKQQ